jgi:hypothetical protein
VQTKAVTFDIHVLEEFDLLQRGAKRDFDPCSLALPDTLQGKHTPNNKVYSLTDQCGLNLKPEQFDEAIHPENGNGLSTNPF